MNENIDIKPKFLSPFKRFCMTIGELPTSYVETMTYYEMILWFTKYLGDTVIPAINNNAEALREVQSLFIELQDYVNNYFDDLNIQTEINNKLDDMAESGQLAEIIAQYLEVASILGFDTKADLKGADNLIDGSFAKTLGDINYNDGKGNLYKIRTKTNEDVVDDNNIIALTNFNTLIAEKIPNYRINQIETTLNRITNKKYIMVGDSYAEGYTPDGYVTGWADLLKSLMNLNSSNCTIVYQGGCGFTPYNNTYSNLINSLSNDSSVTDIIVVGGYNDRNATREAIVAGSNEFKTLCSTKFPNAKIHLGFVGFSNTNERYSFHTCRCNYVYISNIHGYDYLTNVEYSLRNTYECFASDDFHPNSLGQSQIANAVHQAILTGSANIAFPYQGLFLTVGSVFDSITVGFSTVGSTCCNNTVTLAMQNYGIISSTDGVSMTANGSTKYEVATIGKGYITGTNYNNVNIPINCMVRDDSSGSAKYIPMNGVLYFENKKVSISLFDANDNNTSFRSMLVKQIQIQPFSNSYDTLWC